MNVGHFVVCSYTDISDGQKNLGTMLENYREKTANNQHISTFILVTKGKRKKQ